MMTENRLEQSSYEDQILFCSEPSHDLSIDDANVLRSYPLPMRYAGSPLQP